MPDQNTPASGFQFGLANLKPAEPLEKITLTFPDGAKREYPKDITGLDIAKGISPSLAKRTVAMALDGVLADLNDPIARRREDRIRHPRRSARAGTDPARLPRMCWPKRCRRCGRARR